MNTETLRALNAWELANMIDVAMPNRNNTAGADFLISIRDVVADELDALQSLGEWDEDRSYELADAEVPIYTHTLWETFVDLCAYNYETANDIDGDIDMTKQAGVILYDIASALITALLTKIEEGNFDDTASETDHDE